MLNVPNTILQDMFESYTVLDADNQSIDMASNISADNANRLYTAVKTYKPKFMLEIGLAYGISALAILTAMKENNNNARLISIDPYQQESWQDIGLLNIQRSGLDSYHQFLREPDYLVLPRLLTENNSFDMAYIDGWHLLDYVMLDFFFADKMLKVNGVIGFNDTPRPGVKQTIQFLQNNRKYNEVKFANEKPFSTNGQLTDFQRRFQRISRSGNLTKKLLKSLRFRLTNLSLADRYFQKKANWEPGDSEYYEFSEYTAQA